MQILGKGTKINRQYFDKESSCLLYTSVPVVKIDDAKDAVPLAKALCDGGLPCAEITFRTSAAEEAIRKIHEAFPQMLLGAGTVLTTEQVDRAIGAGATFIVSPGLNPKVVKYCVDKGIPVTPGCSNPSDIEQAIELGLDVVKFFPAEAAGGLKMIKMCIRDSLKSSLKEVFSQEEKSGEIEMKPFETMVFLLP